MGANVVLHDYTGHAADVRTDAQGNVTLTVPVNRNGLGYVCYSPAGQGGGFEIVPRAVQQDFEGAKDLDLLPAAAGQAVQPGRVWCAAHAALRAQLQVAAAGWSEATSLRLELIAPDGATLAQQTLTKASPAQAVSVTTAAEGFHVLRLSAANPPAGAALPYKVSVTYTAPLRLEDPARAAHDAAAALADAAQVGQWSALIELPNVPIHAHLLPTGKLLFWGRRSPPATNDFPSLNQHATHAFLWDPLQPNAAAKPTANQPTDAAGQPINLFCSGHTFLADGRLLVTGGHLFDSQGLNCSTFYDAARDQWSAGPVMNNGRWYPTAVTLPDGRAFVCSGSFPTGPLQPPLNANTINDVPQVLENGAWRDLTNFIGLPLYPRFHVAPNGALFMSGALATSYFFADFAAGQAGTWVPIGMRSAGNSDYAPAVMYEPGKVIFIGGGAPTNIVETIDLTAPKPAWRVAAPMSIARRQHNATLLADGSVLVIGGTRGSNFDNLGNGQPVHGAELWNPVTGSWTELAPEAVDRCYHSSAVLLPDGRVFSGGGGEYAPVVGVNQANPPINSHANAQLFSPPYLFKGARPVIGKAPEAVAYGATFDIETPVPAEISAISWIRLSSVTHSFDQNQRINFLQFTRGAGKLTATAPANGNLCPPGHYMLFLLNAQQVPSIAAIMQITSAAAAPGAARADFAAAPAPTPVKFMARAPRLPTPLERDAAIQAQEPEPPVVIGVTPTCPYGISACWGGAYEALRHLDGVRLVRPVPNAEDSTAFAYLARPGLPNLDAWPREFAAIANGTHHFRGAEVTLRGQLKREPDGSLQLAGSEARPALQLRPIEAAHKIQWDATSGQVQPLQPAEQQAYASLEQQARAKAPLTVSITGPLQKTAAGYILEVRRFSIIEANANVLIT
jgi:hypothetical protein